MKYYAGDIVYDTYSESFWSDNGAEALIKITKVTKNFYYGYYIESLKEKAFIKKNSDQTLRLHKRGLSDILKRL